MQNRKIIKEVLNLFGDLKFGNYLSRPFYKHLEIYIESNLVQYSFLS